ncbi:MAG: hypothetical protein RJB60_844 [Pseudomonadota bacterium]|jgi:hypothetical protein
MPKPQPPRPPHDRPWPWRLLRTVLVWALGLVLLFEEWGWEPLARALAWVGRWPGLRWIEATIKRLPPYGALALFALPALCLLPIKLLALYWLGHGHTVAGVALILAAKVGGTAITARLFMLTHPTLMKLAWFERLYMRWMTFKVQVLAQVKASPAWQQWLRARLQIQAKARETLAALKGLWSR